MKHLKLYEDYNNQDFITDYDEACRWLISNWDPAYTFMCFESELLEDNGDGTFDYNGSIFLNGTNDNKISKLRVNFSHVDGNFHCSNNNLLTLEGSPDEVDGSFKCNQNHLVTLEHCPWFIKDTFDCSYNNLVTLKFRPKSFEGFFENQNNMLLVSEDYTIHTSNPGFPEEYKEEENYKRFINKLKKWVHNKGHEKRILLALREHEPEEYKKVREVADSDDLYWIDNLIKATKQNDIIDL